MIADYEGDITKFLEQDFDGEMPPCIDYREGHFDDGTSYVSELWSENQVTLVTYFFSAENLKNNEAEIEKYLVKVGKLKEGEEHHFSVMEIELSPEACFRPVGEDIYSVTVAVGDDDTDYCEAIL